MAKSLLRIKAEELREEGKSVKDIAKTLQVSRGSVSLWTRDIILTTEQINVLLDNMHRGASLGRAKSAIIHKQKREKISKAAIEEGTRKLSKLTKREFLIAGLSLYWGEGCKKKHGLEFCNSDPKMVKFLIDWLKRCFEVPSSSIYCRVGVNIIHKDREERIRNYWADITGIPLNQFTKTTFKLVNNKKVYSNFEQHFGTLTVRVAKPGILYNKVLGLIEGMYINEQGSFNGMPG